MVKRNEQKAKPNGAGHNRVQGFVFGINLEGSQDVVMEGIKAFTTAMSKSGLSFAPAVSRPILESGEQSSAVTSTVDVNDPEDTVDETPERESIADVGTSNNGIERKRRIPPTPKVINDLDITAGPMPLKSFVEQKGPDKAQDRLVVVATWLKKHKGYDEITRDHLYTCYQQMGGSGDWKSPNDFDTYLRTMANRKRWFEPGTGQASFKVTIIATNYVDGMTHAA